MGSEMQGVVVEMVDALSARFGASLTYRNEQVRIQVAKFPLGLLGKKGVHHILQHHRLHQAELGAPGAAGSPMGCPHSHIGTEGATLCWGAWKELEQSRPAAGRPLTAHPRVFTLCMF